MLIFSDLSLSHTQVSLTTVDSNLTMICLLRSISSMKSHGKCIFYPVCLVHEHLLHTTLLHWSSHHLVAFLSYINLRSHYSALFLVQIGCTNINPESAEHGRRQLRSWSLSSSFICISTSFNFLLLLKLYLLSIF